MKENTNGLKLNQDQLLRCYAAFDFAEYETIIDAYQVGEHALVIHYYDDKESVMGTYLPYLEKDQMDFVMNGIKLERNK